MHWCATYNVAHLFLEKLSTYQGPEPLFLALAEFGQLVELGRFFLLVSAFVYYVGSKQLVFSCV